MTAEGAGISGTDTRGMLDRGISGPKPDIFIATGFAEYDVVKGPL